MKKYIKDGKIKNGNNIVVHLGGKQIINPKEEQILADGWVEYIYVEPEKTVEDYRRDKLDEITIHDESSMVNEFYIHGTPIWLDKSTRVGLKLRFESELSNGNTETILWNDGEPYRLNLDDAIKMLHALELYASTCYDNTQRHIYNIKNMDNKDDIINYDFRVGYPEKLNF